VGEISSVNALNSPKQKALAAEFDKKYFNDICTFLGKQEEAKAEIFPPKNEIFAAFNHTPYDKVKVVIIGQGFVFIDSFFVISSIRTLTETSTVSLIF